MVQALHLSKAPPASGRSCASTGTSRFPGAARWLAGPSSKAARRRALPSLRIVHRTDVGERRQEPQLAVGGGPCPAAAADSLVSRAEDVQPGVATGWIACMAHTPRSIQPENLLKPMPGRR